jgi:myo-inositol-1-phosphate synthase
MAKKEKVKVAIVGVGNCASALVQGVEYYRNAAEDAEIPGLMHAKIGPYHISDIEFTAAFDVVATKVGKDLSEAIWAEPNNTIKFAEISQMNVPVHRGMTHDGIGKYLTTVVEKAPGPTDNIIQILKDTGTDVVVNFLPVGSEMATKWYVEQALEAGCAFVNCIPVFIASSEYWEPRFAEKGLPIIGDDIKSQVGATITHRVLTNLFKDRGVHLDHTYQLNFGGNMDFYNMLERDRLESKKISKTNAVTSQLPYDLGDGNVHVGPSDYVPWLTDRKWCHIRMEGRAFGNVPLYLELKLEVWDSPNRRGYRCCSVCQNCS